MAVVAKSLSPGIKKRQNMTRLRITAAKKSPF